MVFWNATANQFIVQNPQTAQNWVIGSTGTLVNETRFGPQPPATVDAHSTPIDFDADGTWAPNERILNGRTVFAGLQTLNYDLPSTAPAGQTIARVRLSSIGQLQPTGFYYDGEVEDYAVTIHVAAPPTVESVTINDGDSQR